MGAGAGMTFEEQLAPAASKVIEVSPGIYAYIQPDGGWYVNNSGFLLGQLSVIEIDTAATEERTRGMRAAIAGVTDRPVSTVLNTHNHTDHTNGNYQFRPATIVAHERSREMMLANGVSRPDPNSPFPDIEWGALELAPPFLTYDTGITLWSDLLRCEVRHVGRPAHTTDDSIMWIPDRSVLFTGDLAFNGSAPLVSAGSVAGAITILQDLLSLRPQTVVPGHGEVCGSEVFTVLISYLEFVQDLAASGHRAGRTPLQAALDAGDHPYRDLLDGERLAANLHRAYAEIDGIEPGAPIDLLATRRDMIAYNGGRRLRCHA
jgi:cyclase